MSWFGSPALRRRPGRCPIRARMSPRLTASWQKPWSRWTVWGISSLSPTTAAPMRYPMQASVTGRMDPQARAAELLGVI